MPPPKPQRQRTEIAARYRFFDVLRHEIVDAGAEKSREVFTFACADWVAVVPVTPDGKFVLVRQHRHGIDDDSIEVPGGIMDEGEDPLSAGLRELREETGYASSSVVSLGSCHPNPALQGNRYHMYLARDTTLVGHPEFDVGEYCEVVLLDEGEVRAAAADGRISHALVLVSLARAFEALQKG
jgi:ADP-ribose pyrophosphatase